MDNENKWSELLKAAVSEPGLILKAYSNFHAYSLGNQIAAIVQCHQRYVEYKIKLQTTLPILHIL